MDSGLTLIRYLRNSEQDSKELAVGFEISWRNSKFFLNEDEGNYRFNFSSSIRVDGLRKFLARLNKPRADQKSQPQTESKPTDSQQANFVVASKIDQFKTFEHSNNKKNNSKAESHPQLQYERCRAVHFQPMTQNYDNLVDSNGFPFPSDQTTDFRVCGLPESQRFEAYFRKVISKCHLLCKLCEKKEMQEGTPSEELDLDQLEGLSARDLIDLSVVNQQNSKRVQAFLESANNQTLRSIIKLLHKDLPLLMIDQFGCYIPGCVIRLDPGFAQFCEAYCLDNIGKLCIDKCAVKVMQALAGVSVTFSLHYLAHFKKNYFSLVFNKESMIILNKVILQISDPNLLRFLVEDVEYNFSLEEFERPQLLRLLSSLIERCSGVLLERLVGAMLPHVWWLVDDKFGNYAILTLLKYRVSSDRNTVSSTVLIEPEAMFAKKYRRVLLLNCLITPGYQEFISELVWKLILHPTNLDLLFEQETATWLLIATLVADADLKRLKRVKKVIEERVKADQDTEKAQNLQIFIDEYERLLEMLKSGQSVSATRL